jgi:hypothetical protein
MALSFVTKVAAQRHRKTPHAGRRTSRLGLEALEERVLLSVTANLTQGILSIQADNNPNAVQVLPSDPSIQVLDAGQVVGTFAADQVQLIAFQYGAGDDSFDNETMVPDKQLHLFNSSPLTPAQLSQTGHLDALLMDNTLTLTGPSGAGFQITGNWSAATAVGGDGSITHTFTASGLMVLRSALGDLPFVQSDSDPITITTAPGMQAANFGMVAAVQWDGGSLLSTTDPSSPLYLLTTRAGLQVDAGSAQVGVALGSDLGGLGAPVNNALPYIYFTSTSGQAQFGDIPSSVGPSDPLTVAFDPEDPFLYAHVNEIGVGISLKGYIPFTPTLAVAGLDSNPLYGHLYGSGPIALGDVPAAITGQAVINLDAQHDGQLLRVFEGDLAAYLLTGRLNLSDLTQTDPGDLRVGLNGHADIQYTQAGFAMTVPVDGSAIYTPGSLVVHGALTANPTGGTRLSFLGASGPVAVDANLDLQGITVVAQAGTGTVSGFAGTGLAVQWSNQGISATANLHLQSSSWSADVPVTGSVQPDGTYRIEGMAQAQFAGFGSGNAHFVLTNSGLTVDGDVNVPVGTQAIPVHFSAAGYIHADGQFRLQGTAQSTFAGFSMPSAAFVLDNSGLTVQGTVTAQLGTGSAVIPFSGFVHVDGLYDMTGTAQGQFAGFVMPSAYFVLNNGGLTVNGDINVPLGPVTVPVHFVATGAVQPSGQFSLDGHAQATFAGFVAANADFVLNNSGLTANGTVGVQIGSLSYSIPFSGWVHPDGQYQLTAHVAQATFAGFGAAGVDLTLTNSGLSATASVQLGSVATASLTGTIAPNGQFTLTGGAHVGLAGFSADATFTLTAAGVSVAAGVAVPYVGTIHMGGSLLTGGQYQLTYSGSFGVSGFGGSGWLRLDSSGITAHLDAGAPVLGLQAHLDGYIHSNGQYQLTSSASLNLGPISGSIGFTLNNSGFRGQVHAGIDLRTTIHGPFGAHLDVGFRVAVDVGFAINTSGSYQASGNFTATAYLGLSLSVGIGFSLDNHTFTIHTHDIGFSVWGIGFHPFGDTVVHY